jgi:threonine dehydratase
MVSARLGNKILPEARGSAAGFSFKLRGAYNKIASLSPKSSSVA